ncbi:MAG: hypothetical protein AAF616_10055 [Bacteroidota bacterium]
MSLRNLLILCLSWSSLNFVLGQGQENVANSQQFSLNPNDLGALRNSVNLMTGQVGFPMTVASLTGRGGLNPQFTISYSSAGIQEQVNTWNRTASTGILGLGWTFDYPRIVSDHNGSVTRNDDTYYLLENGSSIELICTDTDPNGSNLYRTYKSQQFRKWTIRFYYQEDRWFILTEGGMTYEYELPIYMVAWGNWIGPSANTVGQSRHSYGWNLTKVINRWGDEMNFSYLNQEEAVGSGGLTHTKYSLLERIESPTGNYLQFLYKDKTYEACTNPADFRCVGKIREYQDPHVESIEPDAYQEKTNSKYLSEVRAYNEDGDLLYKVILDYKSEDGQDLFLGNGEMAKRLLTGIQRINSSTDSIPATRFEYDTDSSSDTKGFLKKVNNSIGGVVSFDYGITSREFTFLGRTYNFSNLGDRDITIEAPTNFETPSLFFGADYVAVLWRNTIDGAGNFSYGPNETYLQVYQWEGEWVKYDIGQLAPLKSRNSATVAKEGGTFSKVKLWGDGQHMSKLGAFFTAQQDFFSFIWKEDGTNDYFLTLAHKNELGKGWDIEEIEIQNFDTYYSDRTQGFDYLGNSFFLSGDNFVSFSNHIDDRILTYNWDGQAWVKQTLTTGTGNGGTFSASSGLIASVSNKSGNEKIQLWVRNEVGGWQNVVIPDALSFKSNGAKKDPDGSDQSFVYAGSTYIVVMADGEREFFYYWDEYFQNFQRVDLIESDKDSYPVFITDHSFGIDQMGASNYYQILGNGELAYHRHGYDADRGDIKLGNLKMVNDIMLTTEKKFDDIFLLDYDFSSSKFDTEIAETSARRKFEVMPNLAVMDDDIYYREPDGSWIPIQVLDMNNYQDRDRDITVTPPGLIFNSIPHSSTEIFAIINGEAKRWKEYKRMDQRHDIYTNTAELYQTGGPFAFAMFDRNIPKHKATSFTLHRYSNQEIESGHRIPIVEAVNVNDGYLNLSNSFDYSLGSARLSVNGRYPIFNRIESINGSSDPSNRPQGYSVSYFYNGDDFAALSSLPSEQMQSESMETELLGRPYLTEAYTSSHTLVSSSKTIYDLYLEENRKVFQIRPSFSISHSIEENGTVSSLESIKYNDDGFVSSTKSFNHADSTLADIVTSKSFKYYREEYGPHLFADNRDFHIYDKVIESITSVNGQLVQHDATVWNTEPTETSIKSTFYKRNLQDNSRFTAWYVTDFPPTNSWRISSKINEYDSRGNIMEAQDFRGDKTFMKYDQRLKNVIATGAFIDSDRLAYTSFEDGQNAGWSTYNTNFRDPESFTGTHSFTGTIETTPGGVGGRYHLFFWYKGSIPQISLANGFVISQEDIDSRQTWNLRKIDMHVYSSYVRIDAAGGKIDEIRLHPNFADVTTRVFDSRDRLLSETDPNMITTFFEYDGLDRQKVVRDLDDVIRATYSYGFKELD